MDADADADLAKTDPCMIVYSKNPCKKKEHRPYLPPPSLPLLQRQKKKEHKRKNRSPKKQNPYNFAPIPSLSTSLNRLNPSKHRGLATVALASTSLPLTIALTATSTFFPLMVTGMSSTSKTNLGTWRALRFCRMAALRPLRRDGVREWPAAGTTKRKTLSSVSCGRRRPTQRVFVMWVLKGGDSTME